MQESLLNSLYAQRAAIHARWDALLRTERVTSPLAYPDALVHLIDWALDQLFTALRDPATRRKADHAGGRSAARPECPCGRNPLLAFFLAGEQALLEALVLEQASHLPIDPNERDHALNELYYVVRAMARREVDAFCSVCRHREAQTIIPIPVKSGTECIEHSVTTASAARVGPVPLG
jgi:hypothetical protein